MNLVELIAGQAAETPSAIAVIGGDGSQLSYGQLWQQVLAVRHGLIQAGMIPGDGVLFSVRPSPQSLVLALGVVAAQGVVVFADPGAGPQMFAARMRLARPRWSAAESVLYAASRIAPVRAYARRRGLLLPNLSTLDVRQHVYSGRWLPGVPRGALSLSTLASGPALQPDAFGDPHQLAAVEGSAPQPGVFGDPDQPAAVIFTSGTTADPRAVVHTGASLGVARDLFQSRVPIGPGDVIHTDQLMLGLPTLAAGACWSMPPLSGTPKRFLEDLASRGATHTFCVPVHLSEILDAATAPLPPRLRVVLLGAAPAPATLLRRAIEAAPHAEVISVYAMTEMLPVAMASAAQKLAHSASGAPGDLLGQLLPGIEARVADDGELLLSGPNLCRGYLGQDPLSWLPTGDSAAVGPAGELILLGRKKDMLIRGKFNLYPGLYEPAINAVEGVREAAYVGCAHAAHGDEEVVLAVVPADPGATKAILQRLHRLLPTLIDHDAIPERIVILPSLPHCGRGRKLDREALRSQIEGIP